MRTRDPGTRLSRRPAVPVIHARSYPPLASHVSESRLRPNPLHGRMFGSHVRSQRQVRQPVTTKPQMLVPWFAHSVPDPSLFVLEGRTVPLRAWEFH